MEALKKRVKRAEVYSIFFHHSPVRVYVPDPYRLSTWPVTETCIHSQQCTGAWYEHALTGLLTKLDGVESYGDAELRKARKEAVKRVEEELKRLDKIKADTQAEDDITETTDSEGTRPIDERPTLELLDPTSIIQADSASSPGIERLFNTVEYVAHSIPTTTSHTSNHEHTVLPESLQDIIGNTSRPQIPGGGSFRTLLVSSPSEVNEGGSDLELEGYVDATPLSGDGDTVTEEVENDGELEPMNKWDLDN
ncbi:hypothetical protein RHS01_05140 [Rhizoctonia solani]|uniref:BAG domain-containing protein n=1 Tax=Rhizoctonia solani TaxID=456999 RepID=A0A8H7IBU0_9AGAM|nr:hypothetical protein RHS01_05140 [Rhizoctonia solani]